MASKGRFLMRHKKKRYLPRKCGPPRSKSYCATISNATKHGQFCHSRLLFLATSKERFLMRHKKKRYLPRKCGPPRSKSYCATIRNATKHGQFCHFGLFASQKVGSPPHVAKNGPFSQPPIQRIYQRRDQLHFGIFSLLGFHFWCFWWPPRSNS